ncbi:MAG: hypothetical protein LQ351_008046 [Letrouitia transgressa]|nr:MAG: hypothetical protein LQ351_008046 [Letrouitia transgressa]
MINGLDNITDTLFNGSNIGDFNISVVIAQGAWVENTVLQRVSNIEESFRIELISRSIDRLWKTPTSNKMFVLFVETADCDGDNTGPPELKYCGDGGVYYAYNFIEGGEGWIAEASAKTYRISQKAGFDPFNFSYIDGTAAFLNNTVGNEDYTSFDDLPGRIPGSWTLPTE